MSIRDNMSPEDLALAKRFAKDYVNGKIKQRTLPNTGVPFDEEKAYDNFMDLCESGFTTEAAKKAYGL